MMNVTKLGLMLSAHHGLNIVASSSHDDKDRTVHSYPADIEKSESFQIVTHLGRNRIRTALEWGNFAADTINSVSLSNSDGSRVFGEYARYLKGKGAKLTLKINDYPEDPENMNHEGGQIRGFELQLSSPVIDLSDPNEDQLIERAFEWSSPLWGMMLSILPTEAMESEVQELESGLPEGARTRVEVNRYERSRKYRNLCLTVLGASCKVCEFNFGDTFGALGEGYMHVHHLIPVSGMPQDYQFDPLKDLVPVCPNCHSMLHKEDPPLSIEKLKTIMLEEKSDHE